jgi:hypothetical protein
MRDPSKEGAASPPSGAGSEARPLRRLGTGVVPQPFARIDWASLIRRVYLEDVLRCPRGGRRRIPSDVTEPDAVVAILSHLGLPARAEPVASVRDRKLPDGLSRSDAGGGVLLWASNPGRV